MEKININQLTDEQKLELKKQIEADEAQKKAADKKRKEEYKGLVDDIVIKSIRKAKYISSVIYNGKKEIQDEFKTLLDLKADLYGIKDGQQSHTFTTRDGKYTITLGHRIIDSFDDTVHTGIAKAKNYIGRIVKDENKELRRIIDLLLKKDKNGNLKASRVMELEKMALEINDPELTEAVEIIKDAWKPTKSSTFIEAYYKDEDGNKRNIPLSITSVIGDIEDENI